MKRDTFGTKNRQLNFPLHTALGDDEVKWQFSKELPPVWNDFRGFSVGTAELLLDDPNMVFSSNSGKIRYGADNRSAPGETALEDFMRCDLTAQGVFALAKKYGVLEAPKDPFDIVHGDICPPDENVFHWIRAIFEIKNYFDLASRLMLFAVRPPNRRRIGSVVSNSSEYELDDLLAGFDKAPFHRNKGHDGWLFSRTLVIDGHNRDWNMTNKTGWDNDYPPKSVMAYLAAVNQGEAEEVAKSKYLIPLSEQEKAERLETELFNKKRQTVQWSWNLIQEKIQEELGFSTKLALDDGFRPQLQIRTKPLGARGQAWFDFYHLIFSVQTLQLCQRDGCPNYAKPGLAHCGSQGCPKWLYRNKGSKNPGKAQNKKARENQKISQ